MPIPDKMIKTLLIDRSFLKAGPSLITSMSKLIHPKALEEFQLLQKASTCHDTFVYTYDELCTALQYPLSSKAIAFSPLLIDQQAYQSEFEKLKDSTFKDKQTLTLKVQANEEEEEDIKMGMVCDLYKQLDFYLGACENLKTLIIDG